MANTYVYVDGFNLYYGCLKGSSEKWLDISALCRALLPTNRILKIKYFTAKVSARPNDPGQPTRQQTLLRALRTLSDVEVYFGHFLTHQSWMPLVVPFPAGQIHANKNGVFVKVIRTEEKGSDVNLGAHLLMDAYKNVYDVAVILSNDSDLLTPIKMVKTEFGKEIGILNPFPNRPSRQLKQVCDFYKPIRRGVLRASQFPEQISDSVGKFTKPRDW